MVLGGALAISGSQVSLFSEEGLSSSLKVSDEVETIRLPLKEFVVKQPSSWSESHEMIALCSLCWAPYPPGMWNLVSFGMTYRARLPFIPSDAQAMPEKSL